MTEYAETVTGHAMTRDERTVTGWRRRVLDRLLPDLAEIRRLLAEIQTAALICTQGSVTEPN